jgi:hypothetical protein
VTLLGEFSNQLVAYFKQLYDLKGVVPVYPLDKLVNNSYLNVVL